MGTNPARAPSQVPLSQQRQRGGPPGTQHPQAGAAGGVEGRTSSAHSFDLDCILGASKGQPGANQGQIWVSGHPAGLGYVQDEVRAETDHRVPSTVSGPAGAKWGQMGCAMGTHSTVPTRTLHAALHTRPEGNAECSHRCAAGAAGAGLRHSRPNRRGTAGPAGEAHGAGEGCTRDAQHAAAGVILRLGKKHCSSRLGHMPRHAPKLDPRCAERKRSTRDGRYDRHVHIHEARPQRPYHYQSVRVPGDYAVAEHTRSWAKSAARGGGCCASCGRRYRVGTG